MDINDLGLSGAAEYSAFVEEVARRLGQSKSRSASLRSTASPIPRLLGWWDERDEPPTDDFLSWPPCRVFHWHAQSTTDRRIAKCQARITDPRISPREPAYWKRGILLIDGGADNSRKPTQKKMTGT